MTRRHPRCLILVDGRRCPREAGKRSGNIYLCGRHLTMWTQLLVEDGCAAATRHALAFSRWTTAFEAQRIIDRLHGRRVA